MKIYRDMFNVSAMYNNMYSGKILKFGLGLDKGKDYNGKVE